MTPTHRPTARPFRLGPGLLAATLLLGCASGKSAAPIRTQVRVEPPPGGRAAAPPTAAELPPLPVAQMSEGDVTARRIQRFDAMDQDLRVVLRGLAESFGLGLQIDPEVRGRVTSRLQNVTLEDALQAIVPPNGYTYSLDNGVLRVGVARLQTRIFSLDYVALSRVGTSTTVIQRRLNTGNQGVGNPALQQGGQAGSLFSGVGDVIAGVAVADLWEELRIALDGLVFDTPSTESESSTPLQSQQGSGQRGTGAYSRVSPNGQRLIINPIAGTILVTAPPAKLAQVDVFIRTFESSVQRQVLIEAKIVEVTLSRDHQFGIDWSAVQRAGNVTVQLRRDPATQGGVELTLGGGTEHITAVVQALATQGDVRVLSSPRVAALNNQRAIFDVTTDEIFFAVTRQPIIGPNGATIGFNTQLQPQQISVGIVLDVLPQVGPDNTITMNIRPVVTSVARVESIQLEDGTQARAPVVDRRETDTMARVRAGETIVIGGLMQTRRQQEETGVPILKDIPLFGRLFGSTRERESKGELVIFLTPTIVAGQPPGGS